MPHNDHSAFTPASEHVPRARRPGDPILSFEDQKRWITARRRVMTHLVDIAVAGPRLDQLVLRGSLALKSCLGHEAREPGDVDWVVQSWYLGSYGNNERSFIDTIIADLMGAATLPDIRIDLESIDREEIWTYDTTPGHRVCFPWQCGDLPPSEIAMDFSFDESMYDSVVPGEIKFEMGTGTEVVMASLEESLAWKIRWLIADQYPTGKDLYDAVLLAERTVPSPDLLHSILANAELWESECTADQLPFAWKDASLMNWGMFLKEYPWVQGTAQQWCDRLLTAMRPTIDEAKKKFCR